jgi:hypothetical protein
MLFYKTPSIQPSDLSLQWPSDSLRQFFPQDNHNAVHAILDTVYRSYWEHNSDERSYVQLLREPQITPCQRATVLLRSGPGFSPSRRSEGGHSKSRLSINGSISRAGMERRKRD